MILGAMKINQTSKDNIYANPTKKLGLIQTYFIHIRGSGRSLFLVLRYILIFNCLENLKIVKYISEFSRYGSRLFGLVSSKYGDIFLDTILVWLR